MVERLEALIKLTAVSALTSAFSAKCARRLILSFISLIGRLQAILLQAERQTTTFTVETWDMNRIARLVILDDDWKI